MASLSDDQLYSTTDPTICRDYLRNVCKRGRKCKFVHPCQDECERIRRSKRIFCHDYQNSMCRRLACKFLHYSREEEEIFRRTGRLPNENAEPSDNNLPKLEETPICKDYLNGVCSRGSSCKYRHVNNSDEKISHPLWSGAYMTISQSPSKNLPTTSTAFTIPITTFQGPVDCTKIAYSSVQPNYHAPALLALSTPAQSSHLQNTPILNSTISPASGSLLKSGNEVFVSTSTPAPLIGVIDGTTTRQTALYAHTPTLGSLNSLVSVTNTSQTSSCSSVLALTADSNSHPTVLHTGALPNAHTTYLLSNNPSHLHHHLLTTGAPHSHAPTLLTIPLPQFPCDGNNGGTLIHPQGAVSCATQHPTVLTGMVPSNTSITNSTTYYPYNVLHINPASSLSSESLIPQLPKHNRVKECDQSLEVTSSVSSPSTAVLAAAAAAGYLAQHMPVIASNNNPTSTDHGKTSQSGSSKSLDVHETAMAAAANLPTVSAAAAAAVAAAAAFAHSTSITAQNVFSNHGSNYCATLFEHDPLKTETVGSVSCTSNVDCSNGKMSMRSLPKQELAPCSTAQIISTAETKELEKDSANESNNTTRDLNNFRCTANPEYLHQQDDHAKTAAAVAAAACIGAMFSQPMAAATNPGSSSVAAMLDNLMGRNSQNSIQSGHCTSPASRHSCSSDDITNPSHSTSNARYDLPTKVNEIGFVQERICASTNETTSGSYSASTVPSVSRHSFQAPLLPKLLTSGANTQDFQFPVHACASSSNWSSVATTMASAAKAAAAAAVAATAAVTGSANFFRLKQFQDKLNPQLQECLDRVAHSESVCCTTSSVGPHVSHCSEQYSHLRSDSDSIPSMSNQTGLNNLSTKAAVTMTSAAAAAAMVAAAATVAAEQQQLMGSNFLSELDQSQVTGRGFSSKKKLTRSPISQARFSRSKLTLCHPLKNVALNQNLYAAEDSDYTPSHESKHFAPKRRKKNRQHAMDSFGYPYSHSNLSNDTEEYDDDGDVFEEDDLESNSALTPSPEVTPPYLVPPKLSKLSDRLNLHYGQQTDESRPASCDTSPSDLLQEPDSWEDTTQINTPVLNPRTNSHCLDPGSNFHHSIKGQRKAYSTTQSDTHTDGERQASHTFGLLCSHLSQHKRHRSSSESCLIHQSNPIITKRRSHSCPIFTRSIKLGASESPHMLGELSRGTLTAQLDYLTTNVNPGRTSACPRKISNNHFPIIPENQHYRSKVGVTKYPHLRRRHRLFQPFSQKPSHSFSLQNSSFMVRERRRTKTVAPSVSTDEDSNRFRDEDTEFADFDYSDDDSCSLTSRRLSLKRIKSTKRVTNKKGTIFTPNSFAHLSCHSASGRQQHALRMENARLRRKVTDLSVANELLLEQFALLRQSNKRAHVVAQMAESATKIMEAHNTPQPGIPLSIAQAAAAVVAAAQHSSTTPTLGGVYVSSPTASNTQPNPQVVAALSASQMHPLFTQIAPGNVLSGRIALSTPQSITAVQLHSTVAPLPQTQPAAAVILQPPQSLDFRHPGIPRFYPHPEPL